MQICTLTNKWMLSIQYLSPFSCVLPHPVDSFLLTGHMVTFCYPPLFLSLSYSLLKASCQVKWYIPIVKMGLHTNTQLRCTNDNKYVNFVFLSLGHLICRIHCSYTCFFTKWSFSCLNGWVKFHFNYSLVYWCRSRLVLFPYFCE